MAKDIVRLPDGKEFPFWGDTTRYAKTYHVAGRHPQASDQNPGTAAKPFKTIGRAAESLQPGEKVLVHAGVYRECVRPARGGTGPDRMIAYEAARGEEVVVKGSEVWKPDVKVSAGWGAGRLKGGARLWMADLPREWFVGYNPFQATNVFNELMTFNQNWSTVEMRRFQLKRGMLFLRGRPLKQVFRIEELAGQDGAFWVEEPGLRIHFRLPKDADPRKVSFEVTTREQIFAPEVRRLGYLRVSGFTFEHAADALPVPQRAAVSTAQGHHWIIEGNTIRYANACGLDLGAQHWSMEAYAPCGHHVVRRNRVSECGICGIAGVKHVDYTLVEENLVERIGGLDVERLYENAGMKFHVADGMLIRRNVFREIRHASGLWLDYLNRNCRVTENVFTDIVTFAGGLYLEVSHQVNLIDRNLFWDIRGEAWDKGNPKAEVAGGHGIKADSCEYAVAAHNFFGKVRDGFAIYMGIAQDQREVGGRTGLARRQKILNNIVCECPKRVCLGHPTENLVNGNFYDAANDRVSLVIEAPPPKAAQDLRGWREFFSFDLRGAQAKMEARLDAKTLELTFRFEGESPDPQEVKALHAGGLLPPGPFEAKTWAGAAKGQALKMKWVAWE
jgi:hypothetical protein